jgi:hypothetical protein
MSTDSVHDPYRVYSSFAPQPMFATAFQWTVFDNDHLARRYWRLAPRIHRVRRHLTPSYVDSSIDPFKLLFIDPDRIVRFSTREYPIWDDRWRSFGAVVDGSWDRRRSPPLREYDGPDLDLYLADRFTETPVHEGLVAHFEEGIAWEETAFIQRVMRQARDEGSESFVWHRCRTPMDVRRRCRSLDRLYESMRERGCVSARRMNAEAGRPRTFRQVMEDEIVVDIGRDGELLFVTGRHRLSLAKILDFDQIPVAIVVRHARWINQREDLLETVGAHADSVHPDLRRPSGAQLQDVSW